MFQDTSNPRTKWKERPVTFPGQIFQDTDRRRDPLVEDNKEINAEVREKKFLRINYL